MECVNTQYTFKVCVTITCIRVYTGDIPPIGLILRQAGDINGSLEHFQQAVVLNPANPANVKQVGRTLYDQHKSEQLNYKYSICIGSYWASTDMHLKHTTSWRVLVKKIG